MLGWRAHWSQLQLYLLPLVRTLMTGQSCRARRLIGMLLNGILISLLAALLYQNQHYLPLIAHAFTPGILGGAFLFYLLSLLIQFWVWMSLMDYREGERSRALDEYIRTIFLGRLPGGLWKLVGRMTVYRAPRLSSKEIVFINLVEIGLALSACGLIMLSLADVSWVRWLLGLGAMLTVLVGLSVWVTRLLPQLQQLRRVWSWLVWLGAYIGSWLCGSVIVYLVVSTFEPSIGFSTTLSAWCIAGAAGLVFQVLPLSVLIRDATLAGLLQGAMPLSMAIVAAFAVRLIMMLCELGAGWLLIGLSYIYQRLSSARQPLVSNGEIQTD